VSHPAPVRSWWLREAGVAPSGAPLTGTRRADVCIVGGGFTGLWTAIRLKEQEPAAAVVCGAGYSGNGVGPSALGGRIVASLALGRDDEWSRCGLARSPLRGLPGEPWRYLGGRVVRAAVARKEHAQDEGRAPGRLDRALAGLAPAGLVPLQ
jgi:hypothetical protein